jgi:aspartate aminotransferase
MSGSDASPVSRRATRLASVPSQLRINAYLAGSVYARRQDEPGVCDFTFGNPHEMPSESYVDALREVITPRNEKWFAYKTNETAAQAAAADSLRTHVGVDFGPEDIFLTTGGFSAISVALKAVGDPGEEVIFSLPPWFFYEPLAVEAGLVPVKVGIAADSLDLDLAAIRSAVTERTRAVIVNSPNNPTGRIYPPSLLAQLAQLLEAESSRIGHRIYLVSDEAYNRIIFDGARFHSPAEFYPHTLLAYTYGKTHLAPGQRIGYLAVSPAMPDSGALRGAIAALQMAGGWIFPNAVMQYVLPRLEQFSIDIDRLQRKRDVFVDALTAMGYRLRPPEGTFYLFVRTPGGGDDDAFADALAEDGVFVLPGTLFETPGFFRISLTASEEMIERSLPFFAAAIRRAGGAGP